MFILILDINDAEHGTVFKNATSGDAQRQGCKNIFYVKGHIQNPPPNR